MVVNTVNHMTSTINCPVCGPLWRRDDDCPLPLHPHADLHPTSGGMYTGAPISVGIELTTDTTVIVWALVLGLHVSTDTQESR